VGDLRLWAERLRHAHSAARNEARLLSSDCEGPLWPAVRLAVSGEAWRGPYADHLSELLNVLARHHLDPLADHLSRVSARIERLADEAEHAARIELADLALPAGFDLFAALGDLRRFCFGSPTPLARSWLHNRCLPSTGYVSIDTDRARDLARLLCQAGGDMLSSFRRLRHAFAELDLEAPPALAAIAHIAADLGDEVAQRVEAYEEADRRAAGGFGDLLSSALFAVSRAVHAAGHVADAATRNPPVGEKAHWQRAALDRAGIDYQAWDPSKGLRTNDGIVVRVWERYGEFHKDHPELLWAGMANLVGPTFYAGWQDLHTLRTAGDSDRAKLIARLLPGVPGAVAKEAVRLLTVEELRWFEERFLIMQKKIFEDLAWQQEAYITGGIAEMRRLRTARQIDRDTLKAWEDIASGDARRIARGNRSLLYREQKQVIGDDYRAMRRHHPPVGEMFTRILTLTAESPVPGGKPYRDVDQRGHAPRLPEDGPRP
jgi:hypothetical protein